MKRVWDCLYVSMMTVVTVLMMAKALTTGPDDYWLAVRATFYGTVFLTLALLRLPEALGARGRFDP